MSWLEEKYLKQISSRLPMFRDKGKHIFNCRCTICGDSQTKPRKLSGYFHTKIGKLFYYCQKCNSSMLFGTFLKEFDSNLYKQFNMEVFKERQSHSCVTTREYIHPIPATRKYIPDIFSELPLVSDLKESSEAYQFCYKRMLPLKTFNFKFAENFVQWTHGHTEKFKTWRGSDHPRIIIPWHDRTGKIIGYSARALDNLQDQKYYRVFVDDTVKEHFFGLDRVDDSKDHYVLEGEIDSLMIDNAIAVSNGKLHTYRHPRAIYIPDSDIRNKHIMKNISDMIDLGLRVCLLPVHLPKDLNDMIQSGLTKEEITDIIQKNTVHGLTAKLQFNNWKITV